MSKALKTYAGSYGKEPAETAKFFEEIKQDSARGSVAAMSALLEEQLARAIKLELFLDEDEEAKLFEGTGPLATFSARITFGHALGLYGRKAKRDLNLFREIRNAFVHSQRHIDFKTQVVLELCRTFDCNASVKDFDTLGARDQFQTAAFRIVQYVERNAFDADPLYKSLVGSFPEYEEDDKEIAEKRERKRATNPKSMPDQLPGGPI
jgi:DNA-binding MltR family transcriptional regulator